MNKSQNSNLLIDTLKGIQTNKTPIWLMRQAGRYLPEYQELRKEAGSFINLCMNPMLSKEVTLQPIKRFEMDAAIVFSDILTIPMACNRNLKFLENKGPILEVLSNEKEILNLKIHKYEYLEPIYETLKLVRKNLKKEKALIGFAGGPFTIALYMLEGRASKDYNKAVKFFKYNKKLFFILLKKLEKMVSDHLIEQINAGAEIVQIFESHADIAKENFLDFCITPVSNIVNNIKKVHPETPIIGFPRNSKNKYIDYGLNIDLNCISIDQSVDPLWAIKNIKFKTKKKICIQGNLDPNILLKNKEEISNETKKIMNVFANSNHIFNLGHGVIKTTPIENVKFLIDTVKNWKK